MHGWATHTRPPRLYAPTMSSCVSFSAGQLELDAEYLNTRERLLTSGKELAQLQVVRSGVHFENDRN